MRARRKYWLALAVVLFGFSALLMSWAGDPKPLPPRVKMPRSMDADGFERLRRRRTLQPVAPRADEPPARADDKPRLNDPLLRAMPGTVKKAAIVVEANAIRYSPIGQLLIDCLNGMGTTKLDALKGTLGIDPLADLDRVSAVDDTYLFTGRFADAKWQRFFEHSTPVALNAHTTLWEPRAGGQVAATWNDQMLIFGPDRAAIDAVVGRLEGTAPVQKPVLDEDESYGEVYGVVAPSALAALLGRTQPELGERLEQVVSAINLHVDASHDVGIVLDARGAGPETADFGKAVGSALVMGRLAASAQGNEDLAKILEFARVVPDTRGSNFRTELALPLSFFEDKLRDCAAKGRAAVAPAGGER